MQKVISISCTILLFIGVVVLHVLNWSIEGDRISSSHYYPALYILLIVYVLRFHSLGLRKEYKYVFCLLLLSIIVLLFQKVVRNSSASNLLMHSIALPALYGFYFMQKQIVPYRGSVKNTLLSIYVLNCLIAIVERLRLIAFFPTSLVFSSIDFSMLQTGDKGLFRSCALLGHPLTNALITSIVMVFILLDPMCKPWKRYILYALGVFSLLCFNARGALLISGLFLSFYILKEIAVTKNTVAQKLLLLSGAILGILIIIGLFEQGYGGRFFEYDVDEDGSILARINVLSIFSKIDMSMFFLGVDGLQSFSLRYLGSLHIENWLILSILSIGILPTFLTILFFIPIFSIFLKPYPIIKRCFYLGVFLGVASTNNSLACGVPAIATFFVCCFAFHVNTEKYESHKIYSKQN